MAYILLKIIYIYIYRNERKSFPRSRTAEKIGFFQKIENIDGTPIIYGEYFIFSPFWRTIHTYIAVRDTFPTVRYVVH